MPCLVCGKKAPQDCQLCRECLTEVTLMKYENPKPATYQAAVALLRERKGA